MSKHRAARYIGQLITELQRIGAVSKGFFGNYTATLGEDTLTLEIGFSEGGIGLINRAETPEILAGIIRSEFGLEYKVEIKQEEGYRFDYDEYEKAQRKALLDIPVDNSFRGQGKTTVEVN